MALRRAHSRTRSQVQEEADYSHISYPACASLDSLTAFNTLSGRRLVLCVWNAVLCFNPPFPYFFFFLLRLIVYYNYDFPFSFFFFSVGMIWRWRWRWYDGPLCGITRKRALRCRSWTKTDGKSSAQKYKNKKSGAGIPWIECIRAHSGVGSTEASSYINVYERSKCYVRFFYSSLSGNGLCRLWLSHAYFRQTATRNLSFLFRQRYCPLPRKVKWLGSWKRVSLPFSLVTRAIRWTAGMKHALLYSQRVRAPWERGRWSRRNRDYYNHKQTLIQWFVSKLTSMNAGLDIWKRRIQSVHQKNV